jgi:hypothetical protein
VPHEARQAGDETNEWEVSLLLSSIVVVGVYHSVTSVDVGRVPMCCDAR